MPPISFEEFRPNRKLIICFQSLCCTPMPTSLSRLSVCLSSILQFLECPICLELITPPAHQCPLGHLICFRCRVYIEKCPICRTNYTRERSLLADQIYNAIIEAFHLNNQSTGERTKKLWERVFGKKKREKTSPQPPPPKTSSRAADLKNKFLTRLIGKAVSVDNLANESIFTANLRKKSISSTDIYPESLKKLSYLHDSSSAQCCSAESLPTAENGTLSRFSSANSCETLNTGRNFKYYNRLRNRNFNDNGENLFQFSASESTETDDSVGNDLFYCPVLESCPPMTAFSLLTHLQQHDGPVIQFFKPKFTVHFPFSFENGAIFIVHFYNKTFFTKISTEENGDIKIHVWIMDTKSEAERFKIKANLRADECRTNLKFKTLPNSIKSTESPDTVYSHQIFVTNSTLEVYFRDKFYTLDLHFKNRET